jgi:hypothetical protein
MLHQLSFSELVRKARREVLSVSSLAYIGNASGKMPAEG